MSSPKVLNGNERMTHRIRRPFRPVSTPSGQAYHEFEITLVADDGATNRHICVTKSPTITVRQQFTTHTHTHTTHGYRCLRGHDTRQC